MGVTVSYRGRIADLQRIEDLEDRVLDLALETGGEARIWRSIADDNPQRMVRGLILDLVPGQETTSLLVSPEGWLIPLTEIEAAEKEPLEELPWCFVKTQFGSIEGHVALVELLTALKKEFVPDLEVVDECGYWEHRDVNILAQNLAKAQAAINGISKGLQRYGLSPEAAEDPKILAARIERIARQVQKTMSRPAEHAPVRFDGDDFNLDDDFGTESEWDAAYRENRRKQERLYRAMEERRNLGEDTGDALQNAMRDEGILPLPEELSDEDECDFDPFDDEEDMDAEDDEPWRESLPEAVQDDEDAQDPFLGGDREHPLQKRSMDLMLRLHDLLKGSEQDWSRFTTLNRGAGEIMGGLAQALSPRPFARSDGWDLVQLRRALRGAAFARGALFPLRAEGFLTDEVFEELDDTIAQMETDILAELMRVRAERGRQD